MNDNTDIEIKASENSKSSIQIKARNPGLKKTRIEIVTYDMRRFPFDVNLPDEEHQSIENADGVTDINTRKQLWAESKWTKSDSSYLVHNKVK